MGKKRSDSPKFLAGEWYLLGENVEGEESDAEALKRGTREEVGLEIEVGQCVGTDKSPSGKDVKYYECFAKSDRITVGSDLEEAMWVESSRVLDYCGEKIKGLMSEQIREYFVRQA